MCLYSTSVADQLAFDALPEETKQIVYRIWGTNPQTVEDVVESHEEGYEKGYNSGLKVARLKGTLL
jgi:hypothetical protein